MTVPNERSSFLRVQRTFPQEPQPLSVEMSKAYVDIAQNVNRRTIGTFSNVPVVTGNNWYLTGGNSKQQTLRQVFLFTAIGNIAHGLNWSSVSIISPTSYGSFTDGTNWYGVLFASNVAIAGQVSFYVTPTNIVVLGGAGVPTITQGYIVLEYVSVV